VQGRGRIQVSSTVDDHSVSISIRDDGVGIEPETAKRIFDPFFTTKAPGRGYGLGLAVCQRIIDESGGRITVETGVGLGSCFTVTLPKSPEKR
jgi:signal transduction histidine kinase